MTNSQGKVEAWGGLPLCLNKRPQELNTGPKFAKKVQVMCFAHFDFPKAEDLDKLMFPLQEMSTELLSS